MKEILEIAYNYKYHFGPKRMAKELSSLFFTRTIYQITWYVKHYLEC